MCYNLVNLQDINLKSFFIKTVSQKHLPFFGGKKVLIATENIRDIENFAILLSIFYTGPM